MRVRISFTLVWTPQSRKSLQATGCAENTVCFPEKDARVASSLAGSFEQALNTIDAGISEDHLFISLLDDGD